MTPATKFHTVLLDYGHGGLDPSTGAYLTPGAKQYTFTDVEPHLFIGEGVTNRETAWRLARRLLAAGVRVYDVVAGADLTGEPSFEDLEQHDVSLVDRVRNANRFREGALLVSLHSNAVGNAIHGPSQSARGASVWTSRGQTASDHIATTLHEAFADAFRGEPVRMMRGDFADGDVDHEADFYVLAKSKMPAVLGEVLFFTNVDDARFLTSEAGQDCIADAYLAGLKPWLLLKPTR